MYNIDRKRHWEGIYSNKNINEVSWYQTLPTTSLSFINQFYLPKTAKIIDIGEGDSFLVDNLLKMGFQDITVFDISTKAIEKAESLIYLMR